MKDGMRERSASYCFRRKRKISGKRAKRSFSRRGGAILAAMLLLTLCLSACHSTKKETGEKTEKEVEIPVIFTVNPTTGKKSEQALVEAFNRKYQGKYEVKVEWIMETEEEYRQNLKRMNVTDHLPAVITDLRMLPSFYRMMIEEGRIEDLSKKIQEDEEWRGAVEEVVMKGCTEADGGVYLSPIGTAAFSCSGIFWNQELFAQAGIEHFPSTWEEFWECCERLKEKGITPLALHTEGTGWSPMLLATAQLASSPEGKSFMEMLYPASYQNAQGLQLANTLQRLFSYGGKQALHADFDVAYTDFFSGKAAMVANGYWMIDQIPQEWKDKVRFSPFPGNMLISSPETFGWSVVASYPDEVKKGAEAFLKFRTLENRKEKERLFAAPGSSDKKARQDYIEAYQNVTVFAPNYQVKWNSILQEETLGKCLPKLAEGEMSAAEFTGALDESIERFQKEW